MNILKKTISVFLMILLIAGVFTSCGSSDKQSDKSLQIVTTVFPAYDWTQRKFWEIVQKMRILRCFWTMV